MWELIELVNYFTSILNVSGKFVTSYHGTVYQP